MEQDGHAIDGHAEELPGDGSPPDAQVVPDASTELVHRAAGSTQLIAAATAADKVAIATEIATTLDQVIKGQGLRTKVGKAKVVLPDGTEEYRDKFHVDVEGWQTLATFLDIVTQVQWTRRVLDEHGRPERVAYTVKERRTQTRGETETITEREYQVEGFSWEAKVVAVRDGTVVGEAEAMCTRTEARWAEADDYALRSMAQTRATSRAIAAAARWIVTLAGYAGTPAEEMDGVPRQDAGDAGAGLPWWTAPVKGQLETGAKRALVYLVGGLEADDEATMAAGEVWNAVKALKRNGDPAVGHVPVVVAAALDKAAAAVAEMDPAVQERKAEAEAGAADAKAQDASGEPSDGEPERTSNSDDEIPFDAPDEGAGKEH